MKAFILFILLSTLCVGKISAQQPDNKFQLVIFEGSEWCANCIRLENIILKDETFVAFLKEKNIEIIRADFPQRKKISKEVKKRNEALAEQYSFDGAFPAIMLACHKSKNTILYKNQSVSEMIELIEGILNSSPCKNSQFLAD